MPKTVVLKGAEPDSRVKKLLVMHNRITALEDALELQSEGHHPLLADDLVNIKKVNVVPEVENNEGRSPSDLDVMAKSFGTLSVGFVLMLLLTSAFHTHYR